MKTWKHAALSILVLAALSTLSHGAGWSAIFTVKTLESNIYQPAGSGMFWLNVTPNGAVPNGGNQCGDYRPWGGQLYMIKLRSASLEGAQAMNAALLEAMNNNYQVKVLYDDTACMANSVLVCKAGPAECPTPNN